MLIMERRIAYKHFKDKKLSRLKKRPSVSDQTKDSDKSTTDLTTTTSTTKNPTAAQFNSVFISSLSGCTRSNKPSNQTSRARKLKVG